VTALCNGDGYVPGVEALGRSLAATGTKADKVMMVSADVSESARTQLESEGWKSRLVEPIENPNPKTAQLFPRFHNTFTKLRAWDLTDYDHIVFLDADTIVLQNVDELFDRPDFAAAPDFFLPDRFNSGVMSLVPNHQVFREMVDRLGKTESYDGGDQGFLNLYFDWYAMPVANRLPAGYNLHHFIYQFLRAHPVLRKGLEHEAKIVHYTVQKPWLAKPTLTGGSGIWWNAYFGVHPEQDRPWKDRLHAAEDSTFEHLARLLVR
jgi:glycogenin glucosyltransferase